MEEQNRRLKKTLSIFLAILLLLTLALSSSLHHVEHNCTGDDCPICALIQTVKVNLSVLNFSPHSFAQVHQSLGIASLFTIPFLFCVLLTPVTEKIRLNN